MGIGALNASLAYTRPCCAFERDAAPPAPGSDTRVELNFTYSSPLVEGDVLEERHVGRPMVVVDDAAAALGRVVVLHHGLGR